jgi:uncharacterized protein YndB with AHSA1/START domain
MATQIEIEVFVEIPIEKAWEFFTLPEHITGWNFAAPEWHCPSAVNNLETGGKFSWRMEAKDGSMGFDFCGTYENIKLHQAIYSKLDDGRKVVVDFHQTGDGTKITETFDLEDINSAEMQRQGWQAILNNYKVYAERKNNE